MRDRFGYRIDQKGYELWIGHYDQSQSLPILTAFDRADLSHSGSQRRSNLSKNALVQITKALDNDLGGRFVVRRRGFFGPYRIEGDFMGQKLMGVPYKGLLKWDLLGLDDEARDTFLALLQLKGSIAKCL